MERPKNKENFSEKLKILFKKSIIISEHNFQHSQEKLMKLKNLILVTTTMVFLSSGCSTIQEIVGDGNTLLAGPCADLTIDEAFFLHEEAKSGFARYLNTREDHLLFDSFYTASDSRSVAQSVSQCWDRRVSHYNAMKNLMELNNDLARILIRNMPDEDPGQMVSVYRDKYTRLMHR
jgi:hypothetical protein